ncbi:MAG: thioredoxin domain-containing protein [Proteobacteria bacterium]|nr:thioredoxin domain-containing protein [Pseudomonadota bacterium]
MLRKAIYGIVLVLVLFGSSLAAKTETIAWEKILGIDLGKLSAEQKNRITSNLNRLANTRGCKGTLVHCLNQGDLTARRHAGYVARMVRKGKDDAFIEKGIAMRKESAHPEEVFDIELSDHPRVGDPKAKVVLVEYACFQCPFCAHLAPKLKNLNKKFGSKLVQYYKFFPVRSHKRGVPSALAGLAAHRQGKFWPMYDVMFKNRADLEDDNIITYAKKSGLDIPKFEADMKDQKAMRYVEKDKLEGMRLGVEGTPTFFINGKQFHGLQEYPEILDRIAEEIDIIEGRIQ